VIEINGLRKSYQVRRGSEKVTVDAVREINLFIRPGEVFGLIGPNGAGKTTTLRMLATLIRPDGGAARIARADLLTQPEKVRRRIGYVAQGGGTWDDATAREEMVQHARMYGISKAAARALAARTIDIFELADFADRRCRTYSGGQRRRVDIAMGLIHRPRVLFLDEPTVGLDPTSRAQIGQEIRRLRADGMTIVLCTHYLDEADALCDRIAIIDHGQVVALGTASELKREIVGDVVTLGVNGSMPQAVEVLDGQPFVGRLEPLPGSGLRIHVPAGGAVAIPQILNTLGGAGIAFDSIELHRPSLDDVYLNKAGRTFAAPEGSAG
jgi:ABC-2 type transport system ATP-binding protein